MTVHPPAIDLARRALALSAPVWVLGLPLLGLPVAAGVALDPLGAGAWLAWVLLALLLLAGIALGLVSAAGAVALGTPSREVWARGVFLGVVLLPTVGLPVGVLLLAGLLSRDGRVAYGLAEPSVEE